MAVYFAMGPTGAIKIGFSENPHCRLGEMGLGEKPVLLANIVAPRPFDRAAWLRFDRQTERSLHERFAHLRLGRSEWFRQAPELWKCILDARQRHGAYARPERTRQRPMHRRGGAPVATRDDLEAELLTAMAGQ